MKKIKLYPARIVFALLALICMITIFSFSRENSEQSSETSGKVTEAVIEVTVKDYARNIKEESIRTSSPSMKCHSRYLCLGPCLLTVSLGNANRPAR